MGTSVSKPAEALLLERLACLEVIPVRVFSNLVKQTSQLVETLEAAQLVLTGRVRDVLSQDDAQAQAEAELVEEVA